LQINLRYDSSVALAPTGFKAAMAAAAQYLDTLIINPITVTIQVGYGEDGGIPLDNGVLGEGGPDDINTLSYAQVVKYLTAAATTANAKTALANLPAKDPTDGAGFQVSDAQEEAWGLLPASGVQFGTTLDAGSVGFATTSNANFSYSTTGSANPQQYSFLGVAEHELTHALGRISNLDTPGVDGQMAVMDLYQYTAKGDLAPVNGDAITSYFSINGGITNLGTFDTSSDSADWADPHAADSFNAFSSPGEVNPVSSTDSTLMNVLGFEVACFATGTCIATLRGEVAVETLRAGEDVAVTVDGRAARILWVGRRRVALSRHPRPQDVMPVRVRAGAAAPGQPARDLLLSPDHAVFQDGVLIPVRHLVNGLTIVQEPAEEITYWHVELDRHDVILAEGLPCESFLDTGNRGAFENGGQVVHLHPDFAQRLWDADSCAPLVIAGPELERVDTRLKLRAAHGPERPRAGWGRMDSDAS
jgi:hypothetical protein